MENSGTGHGAGGGAHSFGRYEVEAEIGRGAMGRVYRARDPLAQRHVAVKVIRDELLAEDQPGEALKRFQREARAAGGLSHPNIVRIYDVAENYFVMELLEGRSLQDILNEHGKLSLEDTLAIVEPLADALHYAHGRGVYHRDIKPANIMVLADGRPVITDFGLARLESTVMTAAGQFLGSPSYMSPEQVIGGEIGPKSDNYSLAVVTYEMLSGKKPFPGDSITTVLYKVVHEPPVPPHEWSTELEHFDGLFERALAKEPDDRFDNFASFARALELEAFGESSEKQTTAGLSFSTAPAARAPVEAPPLPPSPTATKLSTEGTANRDTDATVSAVQREPVITQRKRRNASPRGRWLLAAPAAALGALAIVALTWFGGSRAIDQAIETNPAGAELWLDDAPLGTSPLVAEGIEPGAHRLRAAKDGFLPFDETIEVEPDAIGTLTLYLQPALVSLFLESSPDGAAVRIDGEAVGVTPLEDFQMDPGQHDVEVTRSGHQTWRSVVVAQAGESVNVTARLRRAVSPVATGASAPNEAGDAESSAGGAEPAPAPGDLIELGPDDVAPVRIEGRPPGYPTLARRRKIEGRVTVSYIVTDTGETTEIEILDSAGVVLDAAVVEAIEGWRYEPASRQGVPVKTRLRFRQTFKLGGS